MSNADPNAQGFLGTFLNGDGAAPDTGFPGSSDNSLTPAQSAALSGVTRIKGAIPVIINRGYSLSLDPQGGPAPEVKNYQDVLTGLYQLPADQLASLQQELLAGGFYQDDAYYKGTKRVVPGLADGDTFNAWKEAVTRAAASKKTVDEVLTEAVQKTTAAGGPGAAAKTAVRLTNPTDLRDIAKQEAQSLLGRNPDPGFLDNYVAAYHQQETAGQTIDATTGQLVQAPDPRTFARQLLRQLYPVDVGVNDYLNVGNELVNVLSQPAGGSLPTTKTANG